MAASATDWPRPRRRSRLRGPPPCFYPRPHLLLPQLDRLVVPLDRPTGRLLPRPAMALQQPPGPLHRATDVEQPPDQRLHAPASTAGPPTRERADYAPTPAQDMPFAPRSALGAQANPSADTALTMLPPLTAPERVQRRLRLPELLHMAAGRPMVAPQTPPVRLEGPAPPLLQGRCVVAGLGGTITVQSGEGRHDALPIPGTKIPTPWPATG